MLVETLVDSNQDFDINSTKVLAFIQEVELVSRGYQLSSPAPPIGRIELNSNLRRCKKLRQSLVATLALAYTGYARSITQIQDFVSVDLMDQLSIVYNIKLCPLDTTIEVSQDAPITELRACILKLHQRRRYFLCSLLALDVSSPTAEWKKIYDTLSSLTLLVSQLAQELTHNLEDEILPVRQEDPAISETEHAKKMNGLIQSLRTLQAKMHVVREDSVNSMVNADARTRQLTATLYESLGEDIATLAEEWRKGRNILSSPESVTTVSPMSVYDRLQSPIDLPSSSPVFTNIVSPIPDMLSQGTTTDNNTDDEMMADSSDSFHVFRRAASKRDSWGDWGPHFNNSLVSNSGISPLGLLLEDGFERRAKEAKDPNTYKDHPSAAFAAHATKRIPKVRSMEPVRGRQSLMAKAERAQQERRQRLNREKNYDRKDLGLRENMSVSNNNNNNNNHNHNNSTNHAASEVVRELKGVLHRKELSH